MEDEWVTCVNCGKKFKVGKQVEARHRANWTCPDCANKSIYLDLLDFIKERIAVTSADYENHGRFVLRELVQNADDAGAAIIVLRFEKDALYVANDGRAFTTTTDSERLSDFDAISAILKRTKADDKEMTGHFGSGFQTVYALTNSPEVHSSGRSGRMDPVNRIWHFFDVNDSARLISPFVWRGDDDSRGVIFRLPWRDNDAAEDEYDGRKPFSNANDWPRWNLAKIRKMYEDLRDYVHPVLLCCNRLGVIRLIWAAGGESSAYQAKRDFQLTDARPDPFVGKVTEGDGSFSKSWLDWGSRFEESDAKGWRSYQVEDWKWSAKSKELHYLIRSGLVTDDKGEPLHIGRKADGTWIMTRYADELAKEPMRNDVHILVCLFDSKEAFHGEGQAFLYGVIPLPRQGQNRFAFSGHFFPTQDRLDVAVSRLNGVDGQWYRQIVLSVGRLYSKIFPRFLEMIKQTEELTPSEKQNIVLNAVPGIGMYGWMRPGKEMESAEWARGPFEQLMREIAQAPILLSDGAWVAPREALWPRKSDDSIDQRGASIIRLIGRKPFTEEFVSHPNFKSVLHGWLKGCSFEAMVFQNLFTDFLKRNGGALRYGSALKSGLKLGHEEAKTLIEYCILRETATDWEKKSQVVPGEDGVLRALSEYRIMPDEFSALKCLLSSSMVVHGDFSSLVENIEVTARTIDPDDAVRLLSRCASENPERFETLSKNDYKAISLLLCALAKHSDFKLKDAHLGMTFIPYLQDGKVRLGSPNQWRGESGKEQIFEGRSEKYRRDFIYSSVESEVPGLTKEVLNRIRRLSLAGVDSKVIEKVNDALHLRGLQEGHVPTGFVRHFLSDKHKSLFRDNVLSEFIRTKDPVALDGQKRTFLQAFKVYYDPDTLNKIEGTDIYGRKEDDLTPWEMGKIPCLFDANREWHPPEEFAVEMTPELGVLGYETLHPELQRWHAKTLEALGVTRRPQANRIMSHLRELMENRPTNRQLLADIAALILTSEGEWHDALREMADEEWIPTGGGEYRVPSEALMPTQENLNLLGEDCSSMFDLAVCSAELGKRFARAPEALKFQRAGELGLEKEPTIEMMLERISALAGKRATPPANLQARLADKIRRERKGFTLSGFFFHGGKWWEGHRIVLSDDKELKGLMGGKYLFIKKEEVADEEPYLRAIGARMELGPDILLEELSALSAPDRVSKKETGALANALWQRIESVSGQITQSLADRYRNRVLYPLDGGFASPMKIILVGDKGPYATAYLGWFGGVYFLREDLCKHEAALHAMGLRRLASLSQSEIIEMIESIARSPLTVDENLAETVGQLLIGIWRGDSGQNLSNAQIWPTARGERHKILRLKDCYIRDCPDADYFDNRLTFFLDRIDGQIQHELRDMAIANGGIPLSKSIKEEYADSGGHSEDEELTSRLHLMAPALRHAFPEVHSHKPEAIDWLKKARAFRAESLRNELRVGNVTAMVDSPCAVRRKDGEVRIYHVTSDATLPDRLTSAIVQECEERGFPTLEISSRSVQGFKNLPAGIVPKAEVVHKVYQLLTRDPTEWHLLIPGMDPIDEWFPPIVDPSAEPKKGFSRTRQELFGLYGCCQVCGRRTPASENAYDACETVRSIVSSRGGRYDGEFEEYRLGNALFLCPSHHALFERRLVKLSMLDEARRQGAAGAKRLRKLADEKWDQPGIQIEVFEATREDETNEPRWRDRTLYLKAIHAKEMFSWLADWIESEKQ